MDYSTALITLNVLVLLGEIALGFVLKNYLPAYATEKGKNLAKKEDIEELTRKVEGVKAEHAKQLEDIAQQHTMLLEQMNQRHQLRLAALDKRLEVHQQAYALWWKLRGYVHNREEIGKVVDECQEFWVKNCLYLHADARHAFRTAYLSAPNHRDLLEYHRGERAMIEENWQHIIEAGNIFVEAVELPSLGEDEYLPLKKGEEDNGRRATSISPG